MNKSKLQNNTASISKWETPRLTDTASTEEAPPRSEEELKQAAYSEGLKQGYQAGLKQGSQEMKQRLAIIDTYIASLSQPFAEQNTQLAETLAVLAGKIAKRLVRRELRTEPETIMALVRDTVTALNTTSQKIDIHLSPDNARIIRRIIDVDSHEQNWNIIDDPLISRTDCKVSSGDSIIDTNLQTRIDLIITQFLGDERSEARP